jgi:hypothetical protein
VSRGAANRPTANLGILASALVVLSMAASCDAATTNPSTTELDLPEPTSPPSSGSTSSTAAEAGEAPLEADIELIGELWREHNQAWLDGFESGVRFWADHNYPDMGCTFEDYMASRFPDGPVEGLVIERLPNLPTVTSDPGWVIPGGRLEGTEAVGRVYTMSVRSSRSSSDDPIAQPEILDLHVTILDGRAHFFFGCS